MSEDVVQVTSHTDRDGHDLVFSNGSGALPPRCQSGNVSNP
jgi:hypothetical protein